MELLKKYFELQKQIYEYFEYKESWTVFPIEDCTKYYWQLFNVGLNDEIYFAETREDVINENGDCFTVHSHFDLNLPKSVYRGEEYTMIVVDTQTDGNKFLQIFDNKKEVKYE